MTPLHPQLTVYLGKRDFVDHLDKVDPVGKCAQKGASCPPRGEGPGTEERSCWEISSHVPFLDGVVLVDPDYLKDRKGNGPRL